MESLSINYPFEIVYKHPVDSISKSVYEFNITDLGFEIYDTENSLNYNFAGISSMNVNHDLPFEILNFQRNRFLNDNIKGYEIRLLPIDESVFF